MTPGVAAAGECAEARPGDAGRACVDRDTPSAEADPGGGLCGAPRSGSAPPKRWCAITMAKTNPAARRTSDRMNGRGFIYGVAVTLPKVAVHKVPSFLLHTGSPIYTLDLMLIVTVPIEVQVAPSGE